MRAHRKTVWVATAVLGALVVFVLVWFQPQKLFIEQRVDEALPQPASTGQPSPTHQPGSSTPEAGDSAAEPVVLAEGSFSSLEHETSGMASIIELADGSRVLRFESLKTSNGPDLRVYLSEIPASDDWYAYGERFLDLGALKGNLGNQNYPIPDDVDLSRYESAVIWCRRFTVGFGVAGLF